MLQIPGLGPKTVALLWRERGVTSAAELLAGHRRAGKLDGLKGVGAKKIQSIKDGIALLERLGGADRASPRRCRSRSRLPEPRAGAAAGEAWPTWPAACDGGQETIGDVDIVCCADGRRGGRARGVHPRFPEVDRVLVHGADQGERR